MVAQLRSNFKNGAYNELFLGYTTIRDVRAPVAVAPQINVTVPGAFLVAGSERSSQANSLAQDYTELTDNYTFPIGTSHRVTVGSQNFLNYRWVNVFGAEHLRKLDVREPRFTRLGPALVVQRRRRRQRHERRGLAVGPAALGVRPG